MPTDVNNNRPMFPDCENYRPEVAENKPSGTPVLTVSNDVTGDNMTSLVLISLHCSRCATVNIVF